METNATKKPAVQKTAVARVRPETQPRPGCQIRRPSLHPNAAPPNNKTARSLPDAD